MDIGEEGEWKVLHMMFVGEEAGVGGFTGGVEGGEGDEGDAARRSWESCWRW